jgi:hypothetical protein
MDFSRFRKLESQLKNQRRRFRFRPGSRRPGVFSRNGDGLPIVIASEMLLRAQVP